VPVSACPPAQCPLVRNRLLCSLSVLMWSRLPCPMRCRTARLTRLSPRTLPHRAWALCGEAVDALAEGGHGLASVYLSSGDRLRCMAVSGYGQLFDGITPGAGVIGRAFEQRRVLRARAGDSAEYRAAADGVADEIAVPLLHDGVCQGVLDVEKRQAFAEQDVAAIERAGGRPAAGVTVAAAGSTLHRDG
jgi:putative methionine-R-sulfoxide reductase with GAF domain